MRYLTILLCFVSFPGLAQNRDELKDTIPCTSPDWEIVSSLDSLHGEVIDTIEQPKAFIVKVIRNHSYELRIALPCKEGFKVISSCPEMEDCEFTFESVDFDKKGNPELLIRWTSEYGTACWGGGFYHKSTGYELWNLDKPELIFSFQDSYEFHSYTEEYEYDTNAITGEVTMNTTEISSESGGFTCVVIFSQKKIVIDSLEKPENWASGNPVDELDEHYEYRYTKSGLIRIKPE